MEALVGECKWGRFRASDLERLRTRADLLARELTGVREIRLTAFAGRTFDSEVQAEMGAGRILGFSAADLYTDPHARGSPC